MSHEEIISKKQRNPSSLPRIVGYMRPLANGDERIPAMEGVAKDLGFKIGEHLRLAYEIEEVLVRKFNERMNVGGYGCAFLSDQGLTSLEIYRLLSPIVFSSVLACYTETNDSIPESFFPLHCEDIEYQGKKPRSVPADKQEIFSR